MSCRLAARGSRHIPARQNAADSTTPSEFERSTCSGLVSASPTSSQSRHHARTTSTHSDARTPRLASDDCARSAPPALCSAGTTSADCSASLQRRTASLAVRRHERPSATRGWACLAARMRRAILTVTKHSTCIAPRSFVLGIPHGLPTIQTSTKLLELCACTPSPRGVT